MRRKKKLYHALGIIQLFTAIGAVPAGILFIADPSGEKIGMNTDLLAGSLFENYLIPGLFLLIVNGIGNITGAFLSLLKANIAGHAGIILGCLLCIWIIIQVAIMGLTSFMQPMFLIVGIAEIILGIAIYRNLIRYVLPKRNL